MKSIDAFWQYSQVRSGLLAGALLVEEAGGIISDTRGRPWSLTSDGFLAAAPGVHRAAVHALFTVR
jgi:myo-inositol-1(or 4)-monophosphatase